MQFWDTILFHANLMAPWQSQQAVINHFLEGSCRIGLRVQVVCDTVFSNGKRAQQFEKNAQNLQQHGRDHPVLVHINWTLNRKEKLQRMKNLKLWFLDE